MNRRVFKPGVGRWFGYAWLVFAAANLVDLGWRGDDRAALVIAAVLVFASAVVYVTALRPRIVADADALRIVNPLRDITVPWADVVEVDALDVIRVRTGGGNRYRCWAIQARNRQRARARFRKTEGRGEAPKGRGRTTRQGPDPETMRHLAGRTHADYVAGQLDDLARRVRRDSLGDVEQPADNESVTWSPWAIAALAASIVFVLASALIP